VPACQPKVFVKVPVAKLPHVCKPKVLVKVPPTAPAGWQVIAKVPAKQVIPKSVKAVSATRMIVKVPPAKQVIFKVPAAKKQVIITVPTAHVIVKEPAKVPAVKLPPAKAKAACKPGSTREEQPPPTARRWVYRFPKEPKDVVAGFTRAAWRRVKSEKDVWKIHKHTPEYTIEIIVPAWMQWGTFVPLKRISRGSLRGMLSRGGDESP